VIGVGISIARSTSSCQSSGNARAPSPWQHVPSTLIATLMQMRERERERERERRKGEKREREEFIFLNGVKQHILFNFLHGLKCYRFVFFKVKTSSF